MRNIEPNQDANISGGLSRIAMIKNSRLSASSQCTSDVQSWAW